MASYDSYNWEADGKWKEYLQNVTVPASGNEQQMMDKLKRRYFKKNVNPDFDENPAQPPPSSYTPPPQPQQPQQPQQRSQPQSQPQSSTQSSQSNTQTPPRQQPAYLDNIFTLSHIYLIVNVVLFAIPGSSQEFSYSCYRRALFSGCVAYGTSLYRNFASGPSSNARVKDFVYYLLYCAAVLSSTSPSLIYLVPLAINSFFMVGDIAVRFTGRLPILSIVGRLLQKVLAYQQHAQFTVAYTELIAFVMSIFQLIAGSASLIMVLTLWQFLTYRYQTAAPSRQMVDTYMGKLGMLFQHRLVPGVVKTVYENARAFFSNYAQYAR